MIKFDGSETINYKEIEPIYRMYPNEEIIIVIKNTKEQSVEEMDRIARYYPKVKFSVLGGLDPVKSKFNNEHYQRRTYYSARELSQIISIYSCIERGIQLDWTETEKAMYVYKKLCDKMQYSSDFEGSYNNARNLKGLLHRKAVCSGFALIYKEALDRLGIECHYQNREGSHSWNIAKLDGKYRALELTWDVCEKDQDGCGFRFFNRKGSNFYQSTAHDISWEKEESEFPITEYDDEELATAYKRINQPKCIKVPMSFEQDERFKTVRLRINHKPCEITKSKDGTVTFKSLDEEDKLSSKSYVRKDGSHFALISVPTDEVNLNKFFIVEETKKGVRIGKVFSEQDLISLPSRFDDSVANGLLSGERLSRKINNFNGYVGYVGQNETLYYSQSFERNQLNIIR